MPTRSTSPRSLVPLLALFALAVILIVAWVSQSRREASQVVTNPRKESGFQEVMSELATKSEETRRATEIEADAPSSKLAPTSKTGRLRLHVTDATSGAPLVGVACRVYAERNGPVTFGKLTTDDDGRASIDSLPENTILVSIERSPPHASACAGVWLRDGETRDLEVRVGAGGVIAGRAVDDTGRPLADVDVMLVDLGRNKVEDPAPEARTNADGRFEVAYVVSRPHSVWIVDGELRPEHWQPVRLFCVLGVVQTECEAQVEAGARVDIGDVILRRPRVLAGRVLDSQRIPVPNALVDDSSGLNPLRAAAIRSRTEWDPTRQPRSLARTKADGSFEFESANGRGQIFVATTEGITKLFPAPKLAPGERSSDLELVLDDVAILEIELRDMQGTRITKKPSSPATDGVSLPGNVIRPWPESLSVRVARADGFELAANPTCDFDGIFRIQEPGSRTAARTLQVEMPTFASIRQELGVQSGLVDRRSFTLLRGPFVRTHLRIAAPAANDSDPSRSIVTIQACVLAPDQFADVTPSRTGSCCGLGASWRSKLLECERDVDFPVRSPTERYWLHVQVSIFQRTSSSDALKGVGYASANQGAWQKRVLHEAHLGPFLPDATIHRIEIPKLEVPAPGPDEVRKPPNVTFPVNELKRPKPSEEPKLVRTRIQLFEHDGKPVKRSTSIAVHYPSPKPVSMSSSEVDDDKGLAEFAQEIRGGCAVFVGEEREDAVLGVTRCFQGVVVPAIVDETPLPVTLAPWQATEVLVSGAALEVPEASLVANLVRLDLPSFVHPSARVWFATELQPLADGRRRFRALLAPGKYEIRLESKLFQPSKTEVEVRNADGLQVFELSSTRR